jgi:hypothetical protein
MGGLEFSLEQANEASIFWFFSSRVVKWINITFENLNNPKNNRAKQRKHRRAGQGFGRGLIIPNSIIITMKSI